MKKLAVIGAGGHGKVVADTAELIGWETVLFFDDGWPERQINAVWPIVGDLNAFSASFKEFDAVVIAIGDNKRRLLLSEQMVSNGIPLATLIHPSATVSRYATLDHGSVVFAGAIINPGATIGMAAIINTAATVDHDCCIGQAVHISPGAHLAGGVKIGDCSWIGIGASIRQQITVGKNVIVGVGAAVISDVANSKIVVGVPAIERN